MIEHAPDLHTAYGRLNTNHISVGQRVRAGQRVGIVGSTGLATGPHLHFEVRNSGTPVDPTDWIDRQLGVGTIVVDAFASRLTLDPNSSSALPGHTTPKSQGLAHT